VVLPVREPRDQISSREKEAGRNPERRLIHERAGKGPVYRGPTGVERPRPIAWAVVVLTRGPMRTCRSKERSGRRELRNCRKRGANVIPDILRTERRGAQCN